jgi:hypothetical protein
MPLISLLPHRLIENTQLQSSEERLISYTLPASLKNRISTIVFILRFYEVADEHQGVLTQAHRVSGPIFSKQIEIIQ